MFANGHMSLILAFISCACYRTLLLHELAINYSFLFITGVEFADPAHLSDHPRAD